MILVFSIFFLISDVEFRTKIDSLENLIAQKPQLSLILELNNLYRQAEKFDSGTIILRKYEDVMLPKERPYLIYNIGENYLFAGKLLDAREHYLETTARFSKSEIANEALERLYLIEVARKDTILLKRLARSICAFEMENLKAAEDSLKNLLKTSLGDYAYFYLALVYNKKGEFPLALGALDELNKNSPNHSIHKAYLLYAEINLKLGNKKKTKEILEELIIKMPQTIYSVQAKELLKDNFPE